MNESIYIAYLFCLVWQSIFRWSKDPLNGPFNDPIEKVNRNKINGNLLKNISWNSKNDNSNECHYGVNNTINSVEKVKHSQSDILSGESMSYKKAFLAISQQIAMAWCWQFQLFT